MYKYGNCWFARAGKFGKDEELALLEKNVESDLLGNNRGSWDAIYADTDNEDVKDMTSLKMSNGRY